jgi:hypothetical protein
MHWHAGRSKNEMAQSLGVDRKTLRKYIPPDSAIIGTGLHIAIPPLRVSPAADLLQPEQDLGIQVGIVTKPSLLGGRTPLAPTA